MYEQLENRLLLAASIVNRVLTIEGSSDNDAISLTVDNSKPKSPAAVVTIQPEGFNQRFPIDGTFDAILINGGDGNDKIIMGVEVIGGASINAGAGNDTVIGGSGDDTINGEDGNDSIRGNNGNDVIDGGAGADLMFGNRNNDTVTYASRTSRVNVSLDGLRNDGEAGEGDMVDITIDTIIGGAGPDRLVAVGAGTRALIGNAGNDSLTSGDGNDTLTGGDGDDRLSAGPGNDSLDAGAGNDSVNGGFGDDIFGGGAGRDLADYTYETRNLVITLDGIAHSGAIGEKDLLSVDVENLLGGAGNDLLTGSSAKNYIKGYAGKDTILGLNGNDTLVGGKGNDSLAGNKGVDLLYGEVGINTLNALDKGTLADRIFTATKTDVIIKDAVDVVTKLYT